MQQFSAGQALSSIANFRLAQNQLSMSTARRKALQAEAGRRERMAELGPGIMAGDEEAIQEAAVLDPEGTQDILSIIDGMEDADRKKARDRGTRLAGLAQGVLDAEDPRTAYAIARGRALEFAPDIAEGLPEAYSDDVLPQLQGFVDEWSDLDARLKEPKQAGLVDLQSPDGERRSLRADNPEVDELIGQGWTRAPLRQETGDPGSFDSKKMNEALGEAEIATRNAIRQTGELMEIFEETPEAGSITASAVSKAKAMAAEGRAIAQQMNIDIEGTSADPDSYSSEFAQLGIQDARAQSLITSLAFTAAAASGQTGRSVSDRDVARFVQRIGGGWRSPDERMAILRDFREELQNNFRTRYRVTRGQEFEGSFDIPEDRIGRMTIEQLQGLNPADLSDEELEEARRRYEELNSAR